MLEYIVRPFQAPNAHGTIIISSNPKETEERAIITWGGEATLPDTQFITTGFQMATCKEDSKELKRDAEPVRIYGQDPGDGPSYIDVMRSNKLYLDKREERWRGDPATAGQTDYADAGDFRPSEFKAQALNDVAKCAVTMTLNNNTTAA
jgi:hypothetical protein